MLKMKSQCSVMIYCSLAFVVLGMLSKVCQNAVFSLNLSRHITDVFLVCPSFSVVLCYCMAAPRWTVSDYITRVSHDPVTNLTT